MSVPHFSMEFSLLRCADYLSHALEHWGAPDLQSTLPGNILFLFDFLFWLPTRKPTLGGGFYFVIILLHRGARPLLLLDHQERQPAPVAFPLWLWLPSIQTHFLAPWGLCSSFTLLMLCPQTFAWKTAEPFWRDVTFPTVFLQVQRHHSHPKQHVLNQPVFSLCVFGSWDNDRAVSGGC